MAAVELLRRTHVDPDGLGSRCNVTSLRRLCSISRLDTDRGHGCQHQAARNRQRSSQSPETGVREDLHHVQSLKKEGSE